MLALHGLGRETRIVSAGCGDFLVPDLCTLAGLDHGIVYGTQVAQLATAGHAADLAAWAQVCAPCIAVAALFERETPSCGS